MAEDHIMSVKSRLKLFPVINLGRLQPTKNPWAMAFVYAPSGNYVVTGDSKLVEAYIKEAWICCIYYISFWGTTVSSFPAKSRWPGKKITKHRGHWIAIGIQLLEKKVPLSKKQRDFQTKYSFPDYEEHDYEERYNKCFFGTAPKSARWRVGEKRSWATNCLFYRKLPKKWLPEWNKFVK